MSVLGLSILVASVSFLCYRHPPSSWSFLEWLQRPFVDARRKQIVAPSHDEAAESKETTRPGGAAESRTIQPIKNEEHDRKAMPPPPPPFKKPPSPPTTPRASEIPTFNLSDSPTAPSFPALNSAQRASGGVRGPPRLNEVPSIPSTTSGIMSIPMRSPLPNRGPPSMNASSSLALPPTHNSIPTKPQKKVLLTPGHSPLDWARLASSPTANLRGLPPSTPYLRVPPSLLKKYTGRKGKDAWTVLGGKVYNMSPYLPYHPGGEPELMKAAGRDGTRLFGEVHPWVNWEGMLEGCLVGIAVEEGEVRGSGELEEMD